MAYMDEVTEDFSIKRDKWQSNNEEPVVTLFRFIKEDPGMKTGLTLRESSLRKLRDRIDEYLGEDD